MICKYFLLFPRLSFILLMVSFAWKKIFLVWCSPTYFCFWCQIKEIIANIDVKELTPFCYRSFRVSGLVFQVFDLLWVDFCVWYKIGVQFYSSACACTIFPTPFIEETVCSPCAFLASLSWINWQYMSGIISVLSTLFHWFMCL